MMISRRNATFACQKPQKTAMSIEKEVNQIVVPKEKEKDKTQVKEKGKQNLSVVKYNGDDAKFHFIATGPAQLAFGITVPNPESCLAYIVIPGDPLKVFRKRTVVFKQTNYVIPNWTGDNFPSVIYIRVDGAEGLIDYDGSTQTSSERVAALQLAQFVATMDDAQQRTYDLRYEMKCPFSFAYEGNNLVFRVSTDKEVDPIDLPLPNPISLHFEVRTE